MTLNENLYSSSSSFAVVVVVCCFCCVDTFLFLRLGTGNDDDVLLLSNVTDASSSTFNLLILFKFINCFKRSTNSCLLFDSVNINHRMNEIMYIISVHSTRPINLSKKPAQISVNKVLNTNITLNHARSFLLNAPPKYSAASEEFIF